MNWACVNLVYNELGRMLGHNDSSFFFKVILNRKKSKIDFFEYNNNLKYNIYFSDKDLNYNVKKIL